MQQYNKESFHLDNGLLLSAFTEGIVAGMEYLEIIQRIIDAEKRAHEISDQVKLNFERQNADVAAELALLKQNYQERAERRISLIEAQEADYTAEQLASLDTQKALSMERMHADFSAHYDAYVEQLFLQIVE